MKQALWILLLLPLLVWGNPTMLAKTHRADIKIDEYFVSEKLDGVRARWNGKQLLSKNGNTIFAPSWFTEELPNTTLDGELWAGRGKFQFVTQTVLDEQPDHDAWREIKYMIFDLPTHPGPFSERLQAMTRLIGEDAPEHLQIVPQQRIQSHDDLMQMLTAVEADNGEGLMLHHQDNHYHDGRSAGLLKLKSFEDAEAKVIGYTQGKGKLEGLVGALIVENKAGLEFRLGSGLSLEDRQHPPAIGSRVTYKFYGLTTSGKPRFASYLRTRPIE